MLLDADEVLTPELQNEIRAVLACEGGNEPAFGAYWIPRLNLYFGRWIRHGGFYPDHKLRLFKVTGSLMVGSDVALNTVFVGLYPEDKTTGETVKFSFSGVLGMDVIGRCRLTNSPAAFSLSLVA